MALEVDAAATCELNVEVSNWFKSSLLDFYVYERDIIRERFYFKCLVLISYVDLNNKRMYL